MSIVYYVPTDGDELLVSTMRDRSKAKTVARLGKVSLCVLDERWPVSYLQVYCDASIDNFGPTRHLRPRTSAFEQRRAGLNSGVIDPDNTAVWVNSAAHSYK